MSGRVVEVYCDGGVIGRNPSPLGGTWACCHIGEKNRLLWEDSGVVTPEGVGLLTVTNNVTELLAALYGLEMLDDGWEGMILTDSRVTLCRLRKDIRAKMNGVPDSIINRLTAAKARLGDYRIVLLSGHPTELELARGKDSEGNPVSAWNMHCDSMCTEQVRLFRESALLAPEGRV